MAMVTTVEEAIRIVKGGVDVVVAQGSDAGGHRSNCDRSSIDVALLTIILPPIIMEKDLCHDCLVLARDSSRKSGKAAQ
jgi:NAD(P)H-dependent flavin oxidoreductase YrpB (nitropropane dioxygenase family)